jgi:hypothetical protein
MIVQIMELVTQYGAPLVMSAIAALGKEEITQADIDALPGLIKPPEDY